METGLIDSIGKLSIEVVAILTLAYLVFTQSQGHDKMSKSIDKLTDELEKRSDEHVLIKKTVERIHKDLNDHRNWSKNTAVKLAKKI